VLIETSVYAVSFMVLQIQVPVNMARSTAVLLHLIGRNLGINNPFQGLLCVRLCIHLTTSYFHSKSYIMIGIIADVCSCDDPLSSLCTNFVG
jgi:hypothetical protein